MERKQVRFGSSGGSANPDFDGRDFVARYPVLRRWRRQVRFARLGGLAAVADFRGEAGDSLTQREHFLMFRPKSTQGDDLDEFKKPKARPANEPDGFVLFDSKRDYLTQIDHYHEWQRR